MVRESRTSSRPVTISMAARRRAPMARPTGASPTASCNHCAARSPAAVGRSTESDAYFYLGGVAYSSNTYLGSAGTNFYATQYAYDTPRGLRTRVLAPTGTINRT